MIFNFEHNGTAYTMEYDATSADFVDVEGNTLYAGEFFFHGPHFMSTYPEITTMEEWYRNWFLPNHATLRSVRVEDKRYLWDAITTLFFGCVSATDLKRSYEDCYRRFRESYSTGDRLLRINQGSGSRRENIPFQLLSNQQTDEPIRLDNGSVGTLPRVWFVRSLPSDVSTSGIWTQMYNYSYRMSAQDFNWYRRSKKDNPHVFFGMELELSTSLSRKEIQQIVTEYEPKQEPFFIFKQDSSISGRFDNKVELVTPPCSPKYLRKNWSIFFKKLDELTKTKGQVIGDYFDIRGDLSNGIHVHIGNTGFASTLHQSKFMTVFNNWSDSSKKFIQDVSKRSTNYWENHYCRVNPAFERRTLASRLSGVLLDSSRFSQDRHSVCQSTNGSTTEVRVFQGIFDIKHILSCLEFTESIFWYSDLTGYRGLDQSFVEKYTGWLDYQPGYRSLKETIKQCA